MNRRKEGKNRRKEASSNTTVVKFWQFQLEAHLYGNY